MVLDGEMRTFFGDVSGGSHFHRSLLVSSEAHLYLGRSKCLEISPTQDFLDRSPRASMFKRGVFSFLSLSHDPIAFRRTPHPAL